MPRRNDYAEAFADDETNPIVSVSISDQGDIYVRRDTMVYRLWISNARTIYDGYWERMRQAGLHTAIKHFHFAAGTRVLVVADRGRFCWFGFQPTDAIVPDLWHHKLHMLDMAALNPFNADR